jgi:hypothetical protein
MAKKEEKEIQEFEIMSVPTNFENKLVKHEENSEEDHVVDDEEFKQTVLSKLNEILKAIK